MTEFPTIIFKHKKRVDFEKVKEVLEWLQSPNGELNDTDFWYQIQEILKECVDYEFDFEVKK